MSNDKYIDIPDDKFKNENALIDFASQFIEKINDDLKKFALPPNLLNIVEEKLDKRKNKKQSIYLW